MAGIETMIMNYYRHMDSSLIGFDFLINTNFKGSYEDEAQALGAKIFRTPGYNPLKYFKYQKYMKELFRSHPEIRIVHGHNGALAYYPLAAAKRSSVPIRIAHSHNTKIDLDSKWMMKNYCRLQLRKAANYYFACSELAAIFYFGPKVVQDNHYFIIRNAIELEKFTYNKNIRNQLRKQHGWDNKLIIGHVGRFMNQKNHSYLIDIFYQIHQMRPDTVLVLIGDGELELKMKEKAESLKLKDMVFFLGSIKNVNEYYQAMDIFVMPSWNEGLPVVGIEAQASGLPCVFADTITPETKITKFAEFYPLKNSPAQWATFVLGLIGKCERNDVTQEMTDAGYNIKIEAKRLQDIYLKLLSRDHPF
jgi:glycosyltransferase involved in cell wall biosynthesis